MNAIIQDNGTQEQSHKRISKKCIIPNPVAGNIFMVWGAVFDKIQITKNLRGSKRGEVDSALASTFYIGNILDKRRIWLKLLILIPLKI